MTVKEAKEWLSNFPDDAPVMINYGGGGVVCIIETTYQYVEDGCPVFDVG